ncbi:MAG TPA: chemotaxis-specific protein-glutamate methyltransferase CheB [Polyangiaceae bacterium]|nr:chemotaxis-specific protein-glutamate methyltransferase CheB [Polyangiaceae bacterium]
MTRAKVLIVDDSAFARKVLRELIGATPDLEVAGHARHGFEALELISSLRPDVVTLDLMMPELDGLGVLRALQTFDAPPRVLLVSSSAADSDIALEGLALGAFDIVHKPTALATDRLYELREDFLLKLRAAAASARKAPGEPEVALTPARPRGERTRVIVVGTSTGGPQALTRLIGALPADLSVPLLCVVHIPEGFTASLAERLDKSSALRVREAQEGLELAPRLAILARAGLHLRIAGHDGDARCHLDPLPPSLHRPSVDVLFESAAEVFGNGVLAVVLTGMGSDGVAGARAVHDAGGLVLTEHPSSTVVDGMPRAVREASLSDAQVTLGNMAHALVERVQLQPA